MRAVSFVLFKQCCSYLEKDYDFNKHICDYGHGCEELFTIKPKGNFKVMYEPCKEKYCPTYGACEKLTH